MRSYYLLHSAEVKNWHWQVIPFENTGYLSRLMLLFLMHSSNFPQNLHLFLKQTPEEIYHFIKLNSNWKRKEKTEKNALLVKIIRSLFKILLTDFLLTEKGWTPAVTTRYPSQTSHQNFWEKNMKCGYSHVRTSLSFFVFLHYALANHLIYLFVYIFRRKQIS